jgi:hypothetical protein
VVQSPPLQQPSTDADLSPQIQETERDQDNPLPQFSDWREPDSGDESDTEEEPPALPVLRRQSSSPEPSSDPRFDSYEDPTWNRDVEAVRSELRLRYPLTNFTRQEIIAAFASLKIRYSVSDNVLLEIYHILNCMRDKISMQKPLPETRYAVTR